MKNKTSVPRTQHPDGDKDRIRSHFSLRTYIRQKYPDATFTRDGKGWVKVAGESLGGLSFNEDEGAWNWVARDTGGDCFALVAELEGLNIQTRFPDVLRRCADIAGVTLDDTRDSIAHTEPVRNTNPTTAKTSDTVYTYTDADGAPLFRVVRRDTPTGKKIYQQRPDGAGGWVSNLDDVTLTLYNLPDVTETAGRGGRVYVVEGEKCADALKTLGLTATCNPMGAGKWRDDFSALLTGANVVILPDDDLPGRKHAEDVAASVRGAAASVRVVPLYIDGESKRDVFDWLGDGHACEDLATLADRAPAWVPESERVSSWADVDSLVSDVRWAWDGWLPEGLLTMLVSESGKGKSALALRIAATYLLGVRWPDGTRYEGTKGRVVWCESESGHALNVSRAKTWGLPLADILPPLPPPYQLEDFQLENPDHVARLRLLAMRDDVRLVVVDSLSGATGRTDENTSAMLPLVKKLAAIAQECSKPVMLLHHLNKGLNDGDGVHTRQVRGSSSIIQLARVVWAIDEPDDTEPTHRRLSCIKNNLAPYPERLGFRIGDGGITFGEAPRRPRQESARDRAKEFILAQLAHGAKSRNDVYEEGEKLGIAPATIRRASEDLHVVSVPNKPSGGWIWSLPARSVPPEYQ